MKNIIILTLLLFASKFCLSQGQGSGYTTINNSGPFKEVISVNNCCYLALATENNTHKRQVIKFDQNFNQAWAKSFSSSDIFGFFNSSVAVANDGNYFILTANTVNGGSAVVIKISPNGNILFRKQYSYPGDFLKVNTISAAAGDDNGFIMGGGACVKNNFLIKCDKDGNIEWSKEYNDLSVSGVKNMASILADNSGYTVASTIGGSDVSLMKVDISGSLNWFKVLKINSESLSPKKMIKLSTGNLALLSNPGTTNSSDIIMFIEPNGTAFTFKKYGAMTDMYVNDIVSNSDHILAVGNDVPQQFEKNMIYFKINNIGDILWDKMSKGTTTTQISSFFAVTNSNGNNYAIFGDAFNNNQWSKTISVIDGNGIGLCTDGSLGLTASSSSTISISNKNINPTNFSLVVSTLNFNASDFNLSKTNVCGNLTIDDKKNNDNELIIFPNPAGDIIYINNSTNTAIIVEIYDATGRLIFRSETENNSLDISHLKPAIYFLKVLESDRTSTSHFVKN